LTDGQLLRSFLDRRDEAAFEALVRRHGPMVRGVCRRVLRNDHDADDAFQAAFLVLIRKARALSMREVVGDFLHGVAYRTALKARAAAARRRAKERQAPRYEAIDEQGRPEWHMLLDEEVSRLPEKYRVPVVLCGLQGHTRKEAARQLGWREGTVAGRLARARALLARRLTRRGVVLSASTLAASMAREASARVSHSLVCSTCNAALLCAAGQAAAVPVQIAALTEGVVRAMFMDKVRNVAVLLASVLVFAIGVGTWRHAASAGQLEEPRQEQPIPPNRDIRKVPVIPAANRKFQINLSISRGKGEKRVVDDARLLAPEGQVASFAKGKQFDISVGGGKTDAVVMGPVVRVVVRSDEGGKVYLDMTVNHPTIGTFAAGDVAVEMESVRVIRRIELGEFVTAKLNTGGKYATPMEVTASVLREANEDAREKTIAEAEKSLKMAEYYRRTGHDDSACFYFQLIERRYPDSVYAERARERLAELKKRSEKLKQADKKEPARVGQIFILGNEKTPHDVIRDQAELYSGQVFSAADLRAAERNLARLKGFKSPPKVTALDPDGDGPYKDIKTMVEEE
jgi:RNA polymerase sigma factor (sigma-70 family)